MALKFFLLSGSGPSSGNFGLCFVVVFVNFELVLFQAKFSGKACSALRTYKGPLFDVRKYVSI